jgi:TatD DNase family protein
MIETDNLKYFDVHTHMHDEAFDLDRDMRMWDLNNNGIQIITIGTDKVNSDKAYQLAHKYKNTFYTVGLHPHDNLKEEFVLADYIKYMEDSKCVAVGECGLDYYYLESDKAKGLVENIDMEVDRQQEVFVKQIEMAKKYNKSLMIHGRPSEKQETDNPEGIDAYEDILSILEKYYKSNPVKDKLKANGNVHFFVGDISIAERFMNIGFTFSFGGVLTLTRDYDDVLKHIPIEYLHAETDSPYVVPRDDMGKRVSKINSSENIKIIINKIAEIKVINKDTLAAQLKNNFHRDFSLE